MSWRCDLCNSQATISCESDQAKLCWECDSRVHGANFLVAKHTRTLLCHLCKSPTPWTGSGPRLTPIVTSCGNCERSDRGGNEDDEDDEEGDSDDEDEMNDDDEDNNEEDEEENQVVPWGDNYLSASTSASSSSSGSLKGPNSQISGSDQESSSRFFDGYPVICLPKRGNPFK